MDVKKEATTAANKETAANLASLFGNVSVGNQEKKIENNQLLDKKVVPPAPVVDQDAKTKPAESKSASIFQKNVTTASSIFGTNANNPATNLFGEKSANSLFNNDKKAENKTENAPKQEVNQIPKLNESIPVAPSTSPSPSVTISAPSSAPAPAFQSTNINEKQVVSD